MRHRQQGVALITVLLVVAVVVVIGAEMSSRLGLGIRRTDNQLSQHQAFWYAISGEAYAKKVLIELLKDNDGQLGPELGWQEEQAFPVEGGEIRGRLRDAKACFNLNALQVSNDDDRRIRAGQFQALLEHLEVDNYQAEQVAQGLADWLDEDDRLQSSLGAEDSEYQSREHPYLAANGPMADASELRAVNGMSGAIYQKIRPHVCALAGNDWALNINGLTEEQAPLLAAWLAPMSLADAESLLSSRPRDGYADVADFRAEPALAALQGQDVNAAIEAVVVKSDHFLVQLQGHYQDRVVYLESELLQDENNKMTVQSRRLGGAL
ncbi:type II secretion system minor pseudopilin GspK [Gallaecimonas sp. GXIMD4217]|uniref:type II secretion system minor pseudopilin GspK n=1 Tax=Gallaecimonas sp. GXIMD4217 TaxID=3131927 RepID=UPI00311B3283